MKTLMLAAIRCSLMFSGVAALSLAYPASVQAVPTTYKYTGHPFTFVEAPYTTSDFVTAMVTLAGPLGANMPLTDVTSQVTAFSFFDGVQTLSNQNADGHFIFATDATSSITHWAVGATILDFPNIDTINLPEVVEDDGVDENINAGSNSDSPGVWSVNASVPDAGSTLSLMTLTLMALGLVARRFKRAAA